MNVKEFILDKLNLYSEKKTNTKLVFDTLKKLMPYEVGFELIRLGENSDGGYLLPKDFAEIKYCYSAGVGFVTQFEKDLEEKFDIKSKMLDICDVPKNLLPKKSKFIKKKLSINKSDQNISINEFIDTQDEIILKLDIEGDEYSNLIDLDEKKIPYIRILILEIHDLRNLRSPFFFKIFNEVVEKLSKYFYFCHLHPNNTSKVKKIGKLKIPDMLELTLINKKRVKFVPSKKLKLPHVLDRKTDPSKMEIYFQPYDD
ncbi:hypothetical protein N9331_04545 [Candidatus Pelagibacter sp.]|nr:hypothetical protein [Candidatus Pelagibacter sp.]